VKNSEEEKDIQKDHSARTVQVARTKIKKKVTETSIVDYKKYMKDVNVVRAIKYSCEHYTHLLKIEKRTEETVLSLSNRLIKIFNGQQIHMKNSITTEEFLLRIADMPLHNDHNMFFYIIIISIMMVQNSSAAGRR
jgi:hypothetical protein